MKAPEDGHAGAYTVSALYANQTRDNPIFVGLLKFPAGRDESHLRRVLGREPPHDVDLLKGELDRIEKLGLARHVGRPELRPNNPSPQPYQICLPAWAPRCVFREVNVERKVTEVRVAALLPKIPSKVVVAETKS